ncbi:DUF3703 domain-containing protein [Mycolicibacterium komossense]|uniref:DUF3703 domain-containing protein n=1 Tax=Mycolicibacterium komossense TaxID=1779 RepID=A0ABT3C941_9MYCO|nr:DUF3703 domain-containing protein [Mycolicibacterium komossense]
MRTAVPRLASRRTDSGRVTLRLIIAAPGSLSRRYPIGNTGRIDAGLMTPMTLPADLAALTRD